MTARARYISAAAIVMALAVSVLIGRMIAEPPFDAAAQFWRTLARVAWMG